VRLRPTYVQLLTNDEFLCPELVLVARPLLLPQSFHFLFASLQLTLQSPNVRLVVAAVCF